MPDSTRSLAFAINASLSPRPPPNGRTHSTRRGTPEGSPASRRGTRRGRRTWTGTGRPAARPDRPRPPPPPPAPPPPRLRRGERGIPGGALEEVGDVAVAPVDERAREAAHPALDPHGLVDRPLDEPAATAAEEAGPPGRGEAAGGGAA